MIESICIFFLKIKYESTYYKIFILFDFQVVDARVGPGLKSMTKFKKRKGDNLVKLTESGEPSCEKKIEKVPKPVKAASVDSHMTRSLAFVPDKFCKIFRKNKKKKSSLDDIIHCEKVLVNSYNIQNDDDHHLAIETPTSPTLSNGTSEDSSDDTIFAPNNDIEMKDNEINRSFIETILSVHEGKKKTTKNHRRKSLCPIKNNRRGTEQLTPFLDTKLWSKIETCCGYVFESNITNAVAIDYDLYRVCSKHKKTEKMTNIIKTKTTATAILFNNEKENMNNYNKIIENLILPSTTSSLLLSSSSSSSTSMINTSAMKKHHLFSKRQSQNMLDINLNADYKTDTATSTEMINNIPIIFATQNLQQAVTSASTSANDFKTTVQQSQNLLPPPQQPSQHQHLQKPNLPTLFTKTPNTKYQTLATQYLHKIKDSGKIVKQLNAIEKTMPNKLRATDFNLMKNLVKICTDKTGKGKNGIVNAATGAILIGNVTAAGGVGVATANGAAGVDKIAGSENTTDGLGNKFSDNSSDSGYEETPTEQQLNVSCLKNKF